jgi:hypothetical protein
MLETVFCTGTSVVSVACPPQVHITNTRRRNRDPPNQVASPELLETLLVVELISRKHVFRESAIRPASSLGEALQGSLSTPP